MEMLRYESVKLFLILIFVIGCAHNKIQPVDHIPQFTEINKYEKLIQCQYPDSFALTQRIILNVAGKQYDFIGQLTMARGRAFRAVTFGEMGGQFIDILSTGDSISILANPAGLPEKPILSGVVEDIKQLFYYNNIEELNYSELTRGLVKISINTSENNQLIYLINSKNKHILNLNYYSKDKHIRSAEFLEYKKYEGWSREIPSYIKLTNHRWHYSLEIRLLKFGTEYNSDKVFKITNLEK